MSPELTAAVSKHALAGILIATAVGALMLPLIRYLSVGWTAKRKDIADQLTDQACFEYLKAFSLDRASPSKRTRKPQPQLTPQTARDIFDEEYKRWYGRRFFLFPGFLLLIVGALSTSFVVYSIFSTNHFIYPNPLFDLSITAIAAMAGAYMWSVNDLTSRARRLDFSPSDVHWAVLRMVIAVPMGYAFFPFAKDLMTPFIAFALGAFPLAQITVILQRLADKVLGVDPAPEEPTDDIVKLQGINADVVIRLSYEDVSTITQLAYCDPIHIVMRSNLTFNFVMDCMDQALAWIYLKGKLDDVRPLGLRGAVDVKDLIDDYDEIANSTKRLAHCRAVNVLPEVAKAIGQTEIATQLVLRNIAADPYTLFLHSVWR